MTTRDKSFENVFYFLFICWLRSHHFLPPLQYACFPITHLAMASFRSAQRKPYSVSNSYIYVAKPILTRWQQQRPSPNAEVDGQWLHDRAPADPAKMRNAGIRAPTTPAASLNNKLVVSNLHYEITPKDLIVRFSSLSLLSFSNICSLIIISSQYLDK